MKNEKEKNIWLSQDSNLGPLGQAIYSTENEAIFWTKFELHMGANG